MSEAIAQIATIDRAKFIRLARRHAAPGIDPEDCVQDATVLALRFVGTFRGESSLSSWFGTIVRNCALMASRGRRYLIFSIDDFACEGMPFAEILRDHAVRADDRILLLESVDAMEGLPQIYRETLKLLYLKGATLTETANHLGIPVRTVKARAARGRTMLRTKLEAVV